MAHRLHAREGRPLLLPRVVVSRLEGEFAYVEASEDEGRRHVAAIIRQLLRLQDAGHVQVDTAYLERLKKAQRGSIYVYFGDDPGDESGCLSTAIIPGEALFFDYSSPAQESAVQPLLLRCAAALDYEILES
jgi:hypothetical protein